jgi:hypothetical protein
VIDVPARVERNGPAMRGGGLVDRPVLRGPELLGGAGGQQDRHEPIVPGPPFDLRDRQVRVLVGHGDRPAQPRVEPEPLIRLPLIHSLIPLGGEVRMVVAVLPAQHFEHRVIDIELVEQLFAHQLRVAAPDVARLVRPGVDAHA